MDDITILTDVQPEFDYVTEKEDKEDKEDKLFLRDRERLRYRLREKFIQRRKEKGVSCNIFDESGNIYIYAHAAAAAAAAAA